MELPVRVMDVELGRFHRPEAGSSFPGLVLVHDVWGLSDHSRELATDLAREGFGVLEIDLYREHGDVAIEDPSEQIRSLDDALVLADLDRGADWLRRSSEGCVGREVGLIGVCMGGLYTLLAACSSDRFRAAAPFYGILSYDTGMVAGPSGRDRGKKPLSPIEAASGLRTPLLASFGREDAFVPDEDVDALAAALATSGIAFEIDRYAGAGHAFLNRTRPDAYHAESSAAAWARVVPFLHAELD